MICPNCDSQLPTYKSKNKILHEMLDENGKINKSAACPGGEGADLNL